MTMVVRITVIRGRWLRILLAATAVVLLWTLWRQAPPFLDTLNMRFHTRNVERMLLCVPAPPQAYIKHESEWSDDEPWREREVKMLAESVQRELHYLQNPSNCSSARVLLCTFDQPCGMGCKLHHVVHCLALAYASRRVLLMVESGLPYQNASWWGTHFLPLTHSCDLSHFKGAKDVEWSEATALGPVSMVTVPIESYTKWFPALYPVAVPRHLSERLFRLHYAPHVWWVGQLLAFLVRPTPKLQASLESLRAKIGFHKPIVGVHVRRTDKNVEAKFFPLSHYVHRVEDFFRHRNVTKNSYRVFLATDDNVVVQNATSRFRRFRWTCQSNATELADPNLRYSPQSLETAILDFLLLADCDYIVCTLTSNMCRAAYELMQTKHADAYWRVASLDEPYFFHGQRDFVRTAVERHVPLGTKEISLEVGDAVAGSYPQQRSYCRGWNQRTGEVGLYPASKVSLLTPAEDFPVLRLE